MGLLRRLLGKVAGARDPAEPPRSATVVPPVPMVATPSAPPSAATSEPAPPTTATPWYLDGTNDGWDETDPS